MERGRLVIPVKKAGNDEVQINFVPCGGLDEYEEVPQRASSFC